MLSSTWTQGEPVDQPNDHESASTAGEQPVAGPPPRVQSLKSDFYSIVNHRSQQLWTHIWELRLRRDVAHFPLFEDSNKSSPVILRSKTLGALSYV